MPDIGEIRKGRELGKISPTNNFIWHACVGCGKERWVVFKNGKPHNPICKSCSQRERTKTIEFMGLMDRMRSRRGKDNPSWKGGRHLTDSGYVQVYVDRESPYYCMSDSKGYVLEHRLVMAMRIGRPLLKQEIVHHINGVRDDNRPDNLEVLPNPQEHGGYKGCSNCSLRKEIRLLSWQVRELREQLQGRLIQ